MDEKIRNIISEVKTMAVAAGQAAGRAAEATGKKAGEVLEQTKLNLRIIDLESEINDLYREIGKTVYSAKSEAGIETISIEEKIALIDEKRDEIEYTRAKIDVLKKTRKCPNPDCGKRCSKDDKFCSSCGAVLE
jgi:ElaB/YqjD/DUF883 family membrane-anchored ribosome-binding protein